MNSQEEDLRNLVGPWLTEDGADSFYRQFVQADEKYTAEIEPMFDDVRCPVKIIWGEDDPWIPLDRAKSLHKLMPRAEFETIPGIGHMLNWRPSKACCGGSQYSFQDSRTCLRFDRSPDLTVRRYDERTVILSCAFLQRLNRRSITSMSPLFSVPRRADHQPPVAGMVQLLQLRVVNACLQGSKLARSPAYPTLPEAPTQGSVARNQAVLRQGDLRHARGRTSSPAASCRCAVCPHVKPVRERNARNPPVAFDERGGETEP
jgi:hypothetical protein